MITEVQEDENGQFVVLPPEVLQELNWNEHTPIQISAREDGSVVIAKRDHWTVEEAQSHLDEIMDDVVHNRAHHIITHEGMNFVMVPYEGNEELLKD